MQKPVLFILDDDEQVLRAVVRDVRSRYRKAYRILSTTAVAEALESLETLQKQQQTVALFLSDQRMPEMYGVDFLQRARKWFPEAKRVLLTAYSDTDAAIRAINEINLDYYLLKPWDPPEEKMYPVLDELLADWEAGYTPPFTGIRVIGYQWSPQAHYLKDFLAGNLVPYQWLDMETNEQAHQLRLLHQLTETDLPAVVFPDGTLLKQPPHNAVAEQLGLQSRASAGVYDVVIIGGGPAGLAAAVYGASEGLKTLMIEKRAPGGQAGTSSRIENYLGFPAGLSGAELARRASSQANRLGAELLTPQEVTGIALESGYKILSLSDGAELRTRCVILAMGVAYRKLNAPGLADFTGAGVYYGAARTEANACRGEDVYIVGGGNSAGQAAMYLSQFARQVNILVRKPGLSSGMSQYLIDQLEATPNIAVLGETEVAGAQGADRLERLTLRHTPTQAERSVAARFLLIFIGNKPMTEWLPPTLLRTPKGYLQTGTQLENHPEFARQWKMNRSPYLLETSVPGIFAAGDVRAGAMNRVASAVGEGSMAIKFVHQYLAEV